MDPAGHWNTTNHRFGLQQSRSIQKFRREWEREKPHLEMELEREKPHLETATTEITNFLPPSALPPYFSTKLFKLQILNLL